MRIATFSGSSSPSGDLGGGAGMKKTYTLAVDWAMRCLLVVAVLMLAAEASAVRPTDGDGWFGNGYDPGVPVRSYDSPGGHFRVWFVEESVDAVQVGDLDADGVPDFVQAVAEHADTTWVSAIDERGFRPPLDDSVYHDTPDFGGDGRYDIYLANINDSDGYRVTEVCTSSPLHCSGYFVMENDFAGFGYPSDDFAIRILTSHELFHSLQDAYDADQDQKWTEGTAVWNTEMTFPETDDLERFARYFLERPDRPFDRGGSSFSDPYPYGAAIWALFLTERFSDDVIRELWEACEDAGGEDPDFLEATDALLEANYQSSLKDAFTEFTRWNLFTAERADPSRSYSMGEAFASVAMEPTVDGDAVFRLEGMSAAYAPVALDGPTRITIAADPAVVAALFVDGVEIEAVDGIIDVPEPGDEAYLVVTSVIRGSRPRDVTIALGPIPDPPDAGPAAAGDGGGCGCQTTGGSGSALILLPLAALALSRRRRPRASR